MLSIIQSQIRLCIIAASLQGIELRTMDMGLTRKKRMWWIHLYMIFKTMSIAVMSNVLDAYGLRGTGWETLSMIMDIVLSELVYVLYIVLWEGEILHILLVTSAGEFITYPVILLILLVNKLEGRSTLTQLDGSFMVLDLLIPAGFILIYFLTKPLLKRIMHFLGNLKLPHRKLLWTAFFLYIVYLRFPDLKYKTQIKDGMWALMVGEIGLLGLLAVMLMLVIVIYQTFMHQQEETFLSMQMRLLRQRAAIVQNTQVEYTAARKLLAEQMRTLQEKMDAGTGISSEEIEADLEKLKALLNTEYRGVFCKDILVDEMLSQIKETKEKAEAVSRLF